MVKRSSMVTIIVDRIGGGWGRVRASNQRHQLLEEIAAEVARMRHRRFVDAGLLEFGERAAGACGGADLMANHAQQRIAEGGALLDGREHDPPAAARVGGVPVAR